MKMARLTATAGRMSDLAQPLQFQRGRPRVKSRPRRIRLRLGHLLAILFLFAAVFVGVQRMSLMAFSSGAFALKTVELSGATGLTRDSVQSIIAPRIGLSLFLLDTERLRAEVEGLSWIKEVRVRKVWPSRLRVTVRERAAMAVLDEPTPTLVDDEGVRLEPADPAASGLPLIRSAEGFGEDYAGKIGLARECLRGLTEDMRRALAVIDVSVPGRVGLELRNNPVRVYLNPDWARPGLAYFEKNLLTWQSRFGRLDYVDLTVPGRAYLGPSRSPEGSAPARAGSDKEVL